MDSTLTQQDQPQVEDQCQLALWGAPKLTNLQRSATDLLRILKLVSGSSVFPLFDGNVKKLIDDTIKTTELNLTTSERKLVSQKIELNQWLKK